MLDCIENTSFIYYYFGFDRLCYLALLRCDCRCLVYTNVTKNVPLAFFMHELAIQCSTTTPYNGAVVRVGSTSIFTSVQKPDVLLFQLTRGVLTSYHVEHVKANIKCNSFIRSH